MVKFTDTSDLINSLIDEEIKVLESLYKVFEVLDI